MKGPLTTVSKNITRPHFDLTSEQVLQKISLAPNYAVTKKDIQKLLTYLLISQHTSLNAVARLKCVEFFYFNDLPNIRLNFFLFADDTNIFFESDNLDSLQNSVLVNWLNVNRLALNVSKTNFVIFSAINKSRKPVTILINRQAIEEKNLIS